jgi:hypothetical protein
VNFRSVQTKQACAMENKSIPFWLKIKPENADNDENATMPIPTEANVVIIGEPRDRF